MDELRSHFALWSIAKSPLFISADLRYFLWSIPMLALPLTLTSNDPWHSLSALCFFPNMGLSL